MKNYILFKKNQNLTKISRTNKTYFHLNDFINNFVTYIRNIKFMIVMHGS